MVRGIPGDRLVLDIHDLVVGVEQFDAVAVGIAHIDVHRMPRSVPPRATFDAGAETEFAGEIAGLQQMVHLGREEREMVQARSGAVEEYDIVRVALTLQEDAPQIERAGWRDIFA